ncbi:hypothetical protein KW805_01180 [Candidatus Pacearchaeota archaeon]|nr:hypothetical protein [Candidatus Pacearchaeota archaeon]
MTERKPRGYWEDFKNVKEELKKVISKLGHFPVQRELSEVGNSSIIAALTKYHGGLNAGRERMGYDSTTRSHGYWKDWKNLVNELQPIYETLGNYPTAYKLRKMGHVSLEAAIHQYHGGSQSVKERFLAAIGEKEITVESILDGYVGGPHAR